MKKKLLASAISVALLSLSQLSMATPITLSGSIADGTFLNAGSYNGSFDGTSVLPSQFQINSASFQFVFSDNSDPLNNAGSSVTGVNYGNYYLGNSGYSGDYYYYYYRNVTTNQTQQYYRSGESVSVLLAGASVGSGATGMTQTTNVSTVYTGQTYQGSYGYNGSPYYYSCGNYTCSGWSPGSWSYYYDNNYTQTTTVTQDWTGNFDVSGNLGQLGLDELLNTGILDINFTVTGNLFLTSARLFLDVTEIPESGNNIPEPSTALLTLAALGGLGGFRLQRRALRKNTL